MNQDEKDKIVAKKLRELADHIESGKYPRVMSFTEESVPPLRQYTLILSYPYPG